MPYVTYEYTDQVLRHVRFRYDHPDIRRELDSHIEELLEDAGDLAGEEKPAYIAGHMGDPDQVGRALDQEHNAALGWVWRLIRMLAVLLVIIVSPVLLGLTMNGLYTLRYMVTGYGDAYGPPVQAIHCGARGQVDNVNVIVDELVQYENGTVELRYRYYYTPFSTAAQESFSLGKFRDDAGNDYTEGGSSDCGGFVRYCQKQLGELDEAAAVFIIDYDYYGRSFYVEIPLEWEAVA